MIEKILEVDIDKSNDCDLKSLKLELQEKLVLGYKKLEKLGYVSGTNKIVRISQGFRSIEYQNELFKKVPKVTNCRGGESPHNYGEAFDISIIIDNKISSDQKLYSEVAEIFKFIGLDWGGDWTGFKDSPHFELKGASARAVVNFKKIGENALAKRIEDEKGRIIYCPDLDKQGLPCFAMVKNGKKTVKKGKNISEFFDEKWGDTNQSYILGVSKKDWDNI